MLSTKVQMQSHNSTPLGYTSMQSQDLLPSLSSSYNACRHKYNNCLACLLSQTCTCLKCCPLKLYQHFRNSDLFIATSQECLANSFCNHLMRFILLFLLVYDRFRITRYFLIFMSFLEERYSTSSHLLSYLWNRLCGLFCKDQWKEFCGRFQAVSECKFQRLSGQFHQAQTLYNRREHYVSPALARSQLARYRQRKSTCRRKYPCRKRSALGHRCH